MKAQKGVPEGLIIRNACRLPGLFLLKKFLCSPLRKLYGLNAN
jgi:hypothetical protein